MTFRTSHEEQVIEMIRYGNLEDLDFGDLQEVMKDPASYKLTFGQVIRICKALQDVVKANNEACAAQTTDYQKKVNAELRKKSRELESRLELVEKKLDRLSEALSEEDE